MYVCVCVCVLVCERVVKRGVTKKQFQCSNCTNRMVYLFETQILDNKGTFSYICGGDSIRSFKYGNSDSKAMSGDYAGFAYLLWAFQNFAYLFIHYFYRYFFLYRGW